MTTYSYDLDSRQVNPLEDPTAYYSQTFLTMSLKQLAAEGGRVTRVRFLSEYNMGCTRYDLSYIHGVLPDGTRVTVLGAPIYLCAKWAVKSELVAWAASQQVYAKGLGLLDEANWSVAY